jgi:hypothetical protein
MMRNDIIMPEEDIQLVNFCIPWLGFFYQMHVIQNDIKIVAPVINFGCVSLLQRISYGWMMKIKTLQNGQGSFWRLGCKVDPKQAAPVTQEAGEFCRGNIGADRFTWLKEN